MGRVYQRIQVTIDRETAERLAQIKGPQDTTSELMRKGIEMLAELPAQEARKQHCFELGRIAGAVSARVEELTPGCIGNLSQFPFNWKIQCHFWNRAKRADSYVRSLMEAFGSPESGPGRTATPDESGAFWFGFHQEQKVAQDAGLDLAAQKLAR